MRITKVYTKTGDKGLTGLVDGSRVPKNHPRIEAYGTVDELNAIIGIIRTFMAEYSQLENLDTSLFRIQNNLFNVGADLATPKSARWENMALITESSIQILEHEIDELNNHLPPLKEFILPGGGKIGAFFHQARTVARRAERNIISVLQEEEGLDLLPMIYLNRLSDYLFVAGRWIAKELNEKEYYWQRDI